MQFRVMSIIINVCIHQHVRPKRTKGIVPSQNINTVLSKEDNVFGMAIRGCAEASFCNATVFLGYRHCCNTNYCNHAITKFHMGPLMISIISGTIMGVFN
ncbi:unnamed protein product [Adineta ricciae]|uniref:Uncharacterized protein n=1 Tax=Adineta ricciae TaxID=249248 RepID=A0A815LFK0_ADIRI|nr:unnamed protein product [Adineta ricciae]